jgi:ribonuclease HI
MVTLRTLLKLALDKVIQQLQVFSDSMLVIKWTRDENEIHNVGLQPLAVKIKEASQLFGQITYTHVFQELNTEADALSKKGQQIEAEFLPLEEIQDGIMTGLRQST